MKFTFSTGDIVVLDFGPSVGHEQKGRRPGVVVSHNSYNASSGMLVVAPITSRETRYPFEVSVEDNKGKIKGAILADHLRSIDVVIRKPKLVGKVSNLNLINIREKLHALLIQD